MPIKDLHVWEQYTRNVKPARGKKTIAPATAKPAKPYAPAKTLQIPLPVRTKTASEISLPTPTFERKREKAMRAGDIDIDAKIDLHGKTQEEAFSALARFMCRNVRNGNRHLLIITGKGRDGEGVLRTHLKDWLEQLPEAKHISAFRPAGVKHGGNGAFYVVLKKKSAPAI